jgi:hypothetical protein
MRLDRTGPRRGEENPGMSGLPDRVAIVSGAATLIGTRIAAHLAWSGVRVVAADVAETFEPPAGASSRSILSLRWPLPTKRKSR